jgi:hypothetical protein
MNQGHQSIHSMQGPPNSNKKKESQYIKSRMNQSPSNSMARYHIAHHTPSTNTPVRKNVPSRPTTNRKQLQPIYYLFLEQLIQDLKSNDPSVKNAAKKHIQSIRHQHPTNRTLYDILERTIPLPIILQQLSNEQKRILHEQYHININHLESIGPSRLFNNNNHESIS